MQVIVDMNGYLANADGSKGEELPAVAGGDDLPVPLEPGKFMPGLVEGLIGANAGDVREVRVTFPARSSIPQLAGKEAKASRLEHDKAIGKASVAQINYATRLAGITGQTVKNYGIANTQPMSLPHTAAPRGGASASRKKTASRRKNKQARKSRRKQRKK